MKRTILLYVSILALFLTFIGCDDTTSNNSSLTKITEGSVVNGIPTGGWIDSSKHTVVDYKTANELTIYAYNASDSTIDTIVLSYLVNDSHDTISIDYNSYEEHIKYWFSSDKDTLYYEDSDGKSFVTPYSGTIPHSSWTLKKPIQNNLLGAWIADSMTIDDTLYLKYTIKNAPIMRFEKSVVKTYTYIDSVDSMTNNYSFTSDSLFIEGDQDAKYLVNSKTLIIQFDMDGETGKMYLTKYSGKIPPDEWFESSDNDPKLINTTWLADSISSGGTTTETDNNFNLLLDFKDESFTQYMLFWGEVDTFSFRYTTENGKIIIISTEYAAYSINGDNLTLTMTADGETAIYYLSIYDGPILPNDWRSLNRSSNKKLRHPIFRFKHSNFIKGFF